jgi:nucleotide-binding universal stress UspA family protein
MFRTILCPLDPAGASERTIALAAGLAHEQKATLHFVYVLDEARDFEAAAFAAIDPRTVSNHLHEVQRLVTSAVDRAVALGIRAESHVVEGGPVWRMILDEATRLGADLIVMQVHPRRGLHRALESSVTEGVLRHATIPVLPVWVRSSCPASRNSI